MFALYDSNTKDKIKRLIIEKNVFNAVPVKNVSIR